MVVIGASALVLAIDPADSHAAAPRTGTVGAATTVDRAITVNHAVIGHARIVDDTTAVQVVVASRSVRASARVRVSRAATGNGPDRARTPASLPTLPSQVLDLTNWKLTLPIGGHHDPLEILQPALKKFTVNPYFMVNTEGNGVVFEANAGGVTTSNSGYPRSELREMTGGGLTRASWSTTKGTNTLTVREAVTHLTVVKPQVTVAQVHDASDDVLVVRLDGPHHLYIEHDGKNYGDLDTKYVLGTVFTIRIVASGGHIKIFYNGVQKVNRAKKSSGDYFKAGCYTQASTKSGEKASAYAKVVIYQLTVSHTA